MKRTAIVAGLMTLTGLAVVTVAVEAEGHYRHESLGGAGKARALILFHPSRDARFSYDLSLALADGLRAAGFSVERETLTRDSPAHLNTSR